MKQYRVSPRIYTFLDRTLSTSVFSWQQILDLMVPGVLDSLSVMFCNMLITALISKNGETSVVAVSLVNPVTWMITNIFNGLSAGGTVVVAQCCGKRDANLLQRAIGMTLWLTIGVGIAFCLPFLLFPKAIIQLLYPEAEHIVMEKAGIYLSGCMWSVMIFTVYTAIFAVLRGLGESKRCLVLSVVINVGYLVFSILFLNMLHMDIQGSVLALTLARVVGTVTAVILLFVWRPSLTFKPRLLLSFDKGLFRSCMHVSIPLGLEQVCVSLGSLVAEMYMIPLGTTALATHAITNSLMGVLYAPAMSVGSLSVTVVGRCIGACQPEAAYHYGKRCNQITRILLILSAVIFYPILPFLLRQYNPSPEAYILSTKLMYTSLPALLLFWPMSNTLPSTLRAASDAVYPSVLSLTILWTISIALGYVLAIPAGFGIWGVWIATWISWAARCAAFYLRFRGKKWLKIAEIV